MNPELMTDALQRVFAEALQLCNENNNPVLTSEHMLYSFLMNET